MAKNDTSPAALFMARLGVPQSDLPASGPLPCPLHPGTGPSVSVRRSEVLPGRLLFTCSHPPCRFSGSMFDLAAAVKKTGMTEVFELFRQGGPLYNTAMKASSDPAGYDGSLDAALAECIHQHEIRAYFQKCRDKLKMHTLLAANCEKVGIKEDALKLLPAGMLLQPAPDCLPGLNGKEYRHSSEYLVLPYTVDGMITAVAVRHPGTGAGQIHRVMGLDNACGIFMEESMDPSDRATVLVTANELDAMAMFAKASDLTRTRYNPVTLLTPDSLARIKGVKTAVLVGHLGSPLSLAYALDLFRNDDVAIRTVSLTTELVNLTNTVMPSLRTASTDMVEWAAAELKKIAAEASVESAASVITEALLGDSAKDKLMKALARTGMRQDVLAAVRAESGRVCDRKYGEIRLRRTSHGYWLKHPENRQLTNFVLYPDCVTEDAVGNKFMNCAVRPGSDPETSYRVEIPFEEMSQGYRLAEFLTLEMQRLNSDFRPFAEALPSKTINNYRLLVMQFDKIRYEEQSSSLGVYGGTVTYPRVKADPEMPDARSAAIVKGLCPEAVQQYAGITYSTSDPGPVIARLLATDNMAVAAFTGVVAHMLQQTVAAYCNPTTYVPRHLLLPNALKVSSMWSGLMRQAYSVAAGTGEGMLFVRNSAADIRTAHGIIDKLNRLPAMMQCAENGNEIVNLTKRARSSLVILAQSRTADKLNAGNSCYFTREDVSLLGTMAGPAEIPEDIVMELRSAWIPLLRAMIAGMRHLGKRLVTEPMPALQACEFLAGLYGVTLSPAYADTFTRFFTDEGVNTPVPFLLDLKDILDDGHFCIASSRNEASGRLAKRSLGYRMDDGVVVFKVKAMKLVSAKDIYNTDHLTEEMRKEGMLLEDSGEFKNARRDYWAFTTDTWQRYVDTSIDMMPEFNDPQVVMIRQAG